jgi:hypothetical protein
MKLFYPVSPVYITQKFGETAFLDYYKKNGINIPGHNGIDFATKHGQKIYASHDGEAFYEIDGSQGHGVVLRTLEPVEYNGQKVYMKTLYWHLCDSHKEPEFPSPVEPYTNLNGNGLKVKAGDVIGYADSTGLSTGDHLHWGLKPCLPGEPKGTFYNVLQNNGMYGAIDPTPFLNGKEASKILSYAPFTFDMEYGDTGEEIVRLQRVLNELGYFHGSFAPRYGNLTRTAVYEFQLDYCKLNWWERYYYFGRYFGFKSRTALNNLLLKL